jgi:acetyltransferase-like isoleucine patch superfamily enzyme
MIKYYRRYGFAGFLRLIRDTLFTKIFFSSSRLIRLPIDIRNKSNIEFGENLTCGRYCRFEVHPTKDNKKDKLLTFKNNVQLNDFVHIVALEKIVIGNNVLIASKVFISDSNHGSYSGDFHSHPHENPIERKLNNQPVEIGDNVWLGEFVSVLQGVKIGQGSIIGSMSVVTKDIPPYSIAVGIPARVIKKFNFETSKWEKV